MTLDRRDHFVDPAVARAETLPASAFTAIAFLERELATVFARAFLLVPPEAAAAKSLDTPDGVFPFELAGRPLFLRRDREGEALRAFPNVCTHAWHTLVQAEGRARTIACPQHGRTFDGGGRCLAQRGFSPETVPGFPRPVDHLRELATARLGPLLFAAAEPPRLAADEWLAPVRASLGAFPFDALERRPHGEEVREVPGNWKLHAWNFMDTFHIPYIHRGPQGLADALELASYRTELFQGAALQWAYARDPEDGFDPLHVGARFQDPEGKGRRVFALWWFLFPNLTLNFYPWGLSVNVYEPTRDAPTRTRFLWTHFVLDEAKYARRDQRWLSAKVDGEDVRALTEVGRGAASGLAPRGRFAPESEAGPHWFHRTVYEAAFGERDEDVR